MMQHAPFSPSASERWVACHGSFGLSLQLPDAPPSIYADDGTRKHDVAAMLLRRDPGVYDATDATEVAPYVKHCLSLQERALKSGIEEWQDHSAVLFGTPDFWCVTRDNERRDLTLHVIDLKTGSGIKVSPIKNPQLMTYAYMLMLREVLGLKEVTLTIVQPPFSPDPVSWTCTVAEIMDWGVQVEKAIEAALSGSREFTAGDHCRWCKAKPICPELRGMALSTPEASLVHAMAPVDIAGWLNKADTLAVFLEAIRTTGHVMASFGVAIPGWILKPKRATRQWADEEVVLEIARKRKIKIWQDKMLSPAMAEKAHPKLPQEIVDQIVAISSGTNLVRDPSYIEGSERVESTKPALSSALKNLVYRT